MLMIRSDGQRRVTDGLTRSEHEGEQERGGATGVDGRDHRADARAGEDQQHDSAFGRGHAAATERVGCDGNRAGGAAHESTAQLRDIFRSRRHTRKDTGAYYRA